MEKKSKVLQRKQREQPQQHLMMNPPLLQEKKVEEEEDFEKWRVVNMQYRALFKKKSEVSFDAPIAKPVPESQSKRPQSTQRAADNLLDFQYLNRKLEDIGKSQESKIKRPALLIQSTEEILRMLPKGESLLEEAEVAVSKNLSPLSYPELQLRETVDELHLKQVQRMESGYIKIFDDLCTETENLSSQNIELEQKIRKFSSQANSENEELEEIARQNEQIRVLEAARDQEMRQIFLMEETISILHKDLSEIHNDFKQNQDKIFAEIQMFKDKVQLIDNQKVESLEYECKEMYRDIQEIELDIKNIKDNWEGDNKDLKKIMEELDENNSVIRKELREIVLSRAVIRQERENVQKRMQQVLDERVEYLKRPQQGVEKDPRNLFLYFDSVLTQYARKIRTVIEGKEVKDTENVVKDLIENQFFVHHLQGDQELKQARDSLVYIKDKHDNFAKYSEKDAASSVSQLVTSLKGQEEKAILTSLKTITQLSPIRRVSPARETSLSSLSKLRDITDKVLKHKRSPSNSSNKSSIDLTLISERKQEHARFSKLTKK